MSDPSWDLLQSALSQHQNDALWLVDENIQHNALHSVAQMAKPDIFAISNRFDIHLALSRLTIANEFSDFNFGQKLYSAIFFRLAKEKALNHFLVNQAFQHLKTGGMLYIAGGKKEGIKSIMPKIESLFSGCEEKRRGTKQSLLGIFCKQNEQPGSDWLDDNDYPTLRPISNDDPPLYSKPGQFGWNKIDTGSAILGEFLPEFLQLFKKPPVSLLDLGCGYGYLCCAALRFPFERIVATDNNAAAIVAVKKNLALHGANLSGDGTGNCAAVIADDCAQSIREKFQCIICNPPFHQGFSVTQDLTDKFLQATQRLLTSGGRALFVVNQFIPLEKKAQTRFAEITTHVDSGGFKLIGLAKPKAAR